MQHKTISFHLRGMLRDLSVSKFNPEFAYENMNLRFTIDTNNTLLSIVNEKGTKEINLYKKNGDPIVVTGSFLGYNTLNNITTIFTKSYIDRIYRLIYDYLEEKFIVDIMYEGDLNFDPNHPIETLGLYENEDIQKVYWLDEINQPRMINISPSIDGYPNNNYTNNSFDFALKLLLNETIIVNKNNNSSGMFAPGTIQYAFSYFNRYGLESSIFYTTPLNYISYNDRGGSPEESVSNSFTISLLNLDTNFEYVRIYSIHRTSLNATPLAKKVVDLSIIPNLKYIDNGINGETIDPAELLFKGSESITAGTFTLKDNTMFLGDIKLLKNKIPENIKELIGQQNVSYTNYAGLDALPMPEAKGIYPYVNLLNEDSSKIKTFKYLDWYRFGILLQHKTGKWSEPIFIKDLRNETPIQILGNLLNTWLTRAISMISDNSLIEELVNIGYVRARGVVVYPDFSDRESWALGILVPTLYNVADRADNSPFAVSSWFARPNSPFDFNSSFNDNTAIDSTGISRSMFLNTNTDNLGSSLLEYKHNNSINTSISRRAEILILGPYADPYIGNSIMDNSSFVLTRGCLYYVDQSIMTFHSPDIEFGDVIKNLNNDSLKLRIVGAVPITSNTSDLDIITSTAAAQGKIREGVTKSMSYPVANAPKVPKGYRVEYFTLAGVPWVRYYMTSESISPGSGGFGFYDKTPQFTNISRLGARSLSAGINWFDYIYGNDTKQTGFLIYPWHRNGSLNNLGIPDQDDETRYSMLEAKKMSNLRFSFNTIYNSFSNIWQAQVDSNPNRNGISGVLIFNSNELELIKIKAPQNSGLEDFNYYGNIDKVLTYTTLEGAVPGYVTFGVAPPATFNGFESVYDLYDNAITSVTQNDDVLDEKNYQKDPVSIKYKSTPHAVFAFNYTNDGKQVIAPTTMDGNISNMWTVDPIPSPSGSKPFWMANLTSFPGIYQDVINTPATGGNSRNIGYGYYWLAELYNDNILNRFGGTTEDAIENNLWLPAGLPVSLIDTNGNPKDYVLIIYSEGDTFYQRYDCLKTYPYSMEDLNSVVDIVSFMCETRINLDGRYDRNRGLKNNLTVSPTNFNLFNPVYNLSNNFFNYRALNSNRVQPDNFKNIITWTKTKTLGELTDTWTNITLASTMDMDGEKGPVRALRRFNNEIYSFLDKGISRILFNSRVQINPSDGVPIEIGNSYKVDGKIYIGQNIGCLNKWSITNTLNGLYFIDNLGKSIYWFNGESFISLSDTLGFRTFMSELNSLDTWNNERFNNFITHYDSGNKDIYFNNDKYSLVYSETLGLFTSFYNYERVPLMFNAGKKNFIFHMNKLWEQWGGEYNSFFNDEKPFYTTIVANPEPLMDKIFNNIEYRADTYNKTTLLHDKTFDYLNVWNEYQLGTSELLNIYGKPSSLKKKFRIWRVNIPRSNSNMMDRIRNPWIYLKLQMNNPLKTRTELHDILVGYFV